MNTLSQQHKFVLSTAIGFLTLAAGLSAPAQAAINLAEKPLFLGVPVKPAFIMALDDSGSMQWDVLSTNQDGEFVWGRNDTASTWGFFRNNGAVRQDANDADRTADWLELFPVPNRGTKRRVIPPVPNFGFARSHEFNAAYYNPGVTYEPWLNYDGSSYESLDTSAEWQSVRLDPRQGSTAPRYNLTATIYDRADDTSNPQVTIFSNRALYNGIRLKQGWEVRSRSDSTTASNRRCFASPANFDPPRSSGSFTALTQDYTLTGACANAIDVRAPANTGTDDPQAGGNGEYVNLRRGMVIPSGTTYFTYVNCGGLGDTHARLGTWVTTTADITITDTCDVNGDGDSTDTGNGDVDFTVAMAYYAPTYYLTTNTSPDGNTAGVAFTNQPGGPRSTTSPGNGTLYRYEIRPANYASTAEYNAAMANYANWFAYYRTRNLALIAALTRSLGDVNFMRIGLFRINDTYTGDDYTGTVDAVPMHDMADVTNSTTVAGRRRLYNEIIGLPASGSTPNAWAVNQIGLQFQRTSGTTSPVSDPPIVSACQFNAAMLFTDGYHNQGRPTTFGNVDAAAPFNLSPFNDNHSDTLADIASYYYKTNLRPDVTAGLVPVAPGCSASPPDPRLDCNRNQHMNFYGITLGAAGVQFGVTYQQDPDTFAITPDPFVTKPTWPGWANDSRNSVDDLWHATVNTRGQYINATSPDRISRAMNAIIQSINNSARRSAGTAASGARRAVGFTAYVPEFDPNSWTGDVKAYSLNADGTLGSVVWSAVNKLPAPADRKIFISQRKADNTAYELKNFVKVSLGATDSQVISALGLASTDFATGGVFAGRTVDELIEYLRGEDEDEGIAAGQFRPRLLGDSDGSTIHRPIGDILGSQPEIIDRASEGYSILPETEGGRAYLDGSVKKFRPADQVGTYSRFVSTTKATRTPVLIVGTNGGTIHGFNAATSGTARGTELFAVIPASVTNKLGRLAKRDYVHTYLADGSPRIGDACIGPAAGVANCSWKTVATMGMGHGARGVIALDVTDPATSFTASNLLWEITSAQDADIGFVINRPRIFVGEDKKWYAAFGNGLNSATHRPFLFIVDLKTGVITRKIALGTAGSSTDPNGAISVAAVDGDGDDPATDASEGNGYVDTLYVNDFHGKLYKVNLSAANPATWAVDLSGAPLYTALAVDTAERTDRRQFSTGGIDVARHPIRGNLVYYGTGRYVANGDQNVATTPQVQTFYAIWDDPNQTAGFSDRTALQVQTITSTGEVDINPDPAVTENVSVRRTSRNSVLYNGTDAKRGWYIDLYQAGTGGFRSGERILGEPRVISGNVVFTAFQPVGSECNPGGRNFVYSFNATSGTPALTIGGPGVCNDCTGTLLLPKGQDKNTFTEPPTLTPPIVVNPGKPPQPGPPPDTNCLPGTDGCDTPLDPGGESMPGRQCVSTLSVLMPNAGLTPFLSFACGRQAWRQIE